jgi:hypothetical protein
MNPISQHGWTPEERARYGIRGMEDFMTEELALLQAKLAGWMRQRAPRPGSTRYRAPFEMNGRPHAALRRRASSCIAQRARRMRGR